MKYGNCLLWATWQWFKKGGYILLGWTPKYWGVPRAHWSQSGFNWYRYAPLNPIKEPNKLQKLFPIHVLLFKGSVIESNNNRIRRVREDSSFGEIR